MVIHCSSPIYYTTLHIPNFYGFKTRKISVLDKDANIAPTLKICENISENHNGHELTCSMKYAAVNTY